MMAGEQRRKGAVDRLCTLEECLRQLLADPAQLLTGHHRVGC